LFLVRRRDSRYFSQRNENSNLERKTEFNMRMIGQLDGENSAATFSDYLYLKGIENQVEREQDGTFTVWICAEDQIDAAREFLSMFRSNPHQSEFAQASTEARRKQALDEEQDEEIQERVFDSRRLWPQSAGPATAHLTLSLIVASVAVFLLSKMGEDSSSIMPLFITNFEIDFRVVRWTPGLPEIREGQVWRLLTPILIHLGPLHLILNMLWLHNLGGMLERRFGFWQLALLVLVIAAASNFGQYVASSPNFGGMSGVVYGLLGYIWMRAKFDPASGLYLPQSTVVMMVIWYFLCFTPVLPHIANTAHTVGFGLGIAWGFVAARGLPLRKDKPTPS
jgi:GlpG protein